MNILGFCFLIYDKINYEDLWYSWFKNIDINKYKIYIHYKSNIKLKHFEEHKLRNCIQTNYADITLVKAQNLLLQASVNDNCTHQIFLSNSCIPLKTFDYVYTKIIPRFSYFNLMPKNLRKHTKVIGYTNIKLYKIHKASQWCILSSHHSKIILKDKNICESLRKCYAPDELVYLTILLEQYKNEIVLTKQSSSGATTFTNWSDFDYLYPYKNSATLKNYHVIDLKEINYLIQQPCLFGRKFDTNCKIIKNNIPLHLDLSQYLIKKICFDNDFKPFSLICKYITEPQTSKLHFDKLGN
tara:strand:- start:1347 stop:2240 length:894 start_codon:yes stop_codon:yes gene_type:complete